MSTFWFATAFAKQGGVEDLMVNAFFSITNFFDIITLDYKYTTASQIQIRKWL